ncbi:hypothetical protein SRHO_G00088340 [Serrasalmus rhombeus]
MANFLQHQTARSLSPLLQQPNPGAAAATKQLSAVSSAGYGSSGLCAEAGLTVPGSPERITLQQHTGTSGGFPTCCTSSSRAEFRGRYSEGDPAHICGGSDEPMKWQRHHTDTCPLCDQLIVLN